MNLKQLPVFILKYTEYETSSLSLTFFHRFVYVLFFAESDHQVKG